MKRVADGLGTTHPRHTSGGAVVHARTEGYIYAVEVYSYPSSVNEVHAARGPINDHGSSAFDVHLEVR